MRQVFISQHFGPLICSVIQIKQIAASFFYSFRITQVLHQTFIFFGFTLFLGTRTSYCLPRLVCLGLFRMVQSTGMKFLLAVAEVAKSVHKPSESQEMGHESGLGLAPPALNVNKQQRFSPTIKTLIYLNIYQEFKLHT